MLDEIAHNKLDKAAADRRIATACTATKCGKAAPPLRISDCGGFEARVTLPGSQQRTARQGIGTQAAAERPTGLPTRILELPPAAHLHLSPDDAVSRISASRSRAFGGLIVEKASASELDLGAKKQIKQMLRPPFRVARNGEGGGSLTAGHLQ
jgi:hypothetical protein